MFFPNFLTFILETPSLFQHRRIEDTDEKEDLKPTFSYQLCSRRKEQIFQTSKGGSKDLCYSSEPVYSP